MAEPLADSLGVALQLTNILRDIREDLGNGRVYLPAEDLERFGCAAAAGPGRPAWRRRSRAGAADPVRGRARPGWYARGLRLLPLLDRRSAASAGAMAGHLPAAAGPHRCGTGGGAAAADVAAGQGEGPGRGAGAGRDPGAGARLHRAGRSSPAAGVRRRAAGSRGTRRRIGQRRPVGDGPAAGGSGVSGSGPGARGRGTVMTTRNVVVIGGGLAGITAAIRLREAGIGVTLLEARPWLGGATCSFSRGDLIIDNGQHVFLRCCTSYQELLARLGMTGSVPCRTASTSRCCHRRRPGPAAPQRAARPAAPGPGAGRLQAPLAAGAAAGGPGRARHAHADPAKPGLDSQRLGDWLRARGQSEHSPPELWDLFIVSSLNIDGDDASVPLSATVIKTALLGGNDAADIGIPTVPLGDLHGQAAASLLSRLGAEVRLGTKAAAIEPGAGGGSGSGSPRAGIPRTARTGRRARAAHSLTADGVVLAIPPAQAARLAGAAGVTDAARWDDLGSRRSSTCTCSTTAGSPGCRSRRPWTRRCSGCSTRPGRPACRPASTWRCRCRPRTATWTSRPRRCGRSSCARSRSCSLRPGRLA